MEEKNEKFSFKDRILYSSAHSQKAYVPEEATSVTKKKKNRRRKNKTSSHLKRQST
jgi:hypothetical protein